MNEREALERIAEYVEAEWREGDKAFQVAIIARAALAAAPSDADDLWHCTMGDKAAADAHLLSVEQDSRLCSMADDPNDDRVKWWRDDPASPALRSAIAWLERSRNSKSPSVARTNASLLLAYIEILGGLPAPSDTPEAMTDLEERLVRWAEARDRRNPTGHGRTGTELLREAVLALAALRADLAATVPTVLPKEEA